MVELAPSATPATGSFVELERELGIRDDDRLHDAGLHTHVEGEEHDPGYQGSVTYEELEELTERDPVVTGDPAPVEDAVIAFAESFNARDVDALYELMARTVELPGLGADLDGFVHAIEDLWDRNPSLTATEGEIGDTPVVVLWADGEEHWWITGVVTIEASDVGIVLAELTTEGTLLEEVSSDVPEHERDQGSTWAEWDEGAPGQ